MNKSMSKKDNLTAIAIVLLCILACFSDNLM